MPVAQGFDAPGIALYPRQYVCPPAKQAPKIDGLLDDPAWQGAPWTEPFIDIEGPLQREPRLRTRAKMIWDAEYFYVGATLLEPQLWGKLTEHDAVIYYDNDFEVFIDPDGDNHLYFELEVNALNTVWDLMLIKPYRDGAPAIDSWDIAGLRSAVHVDGTLNDPSDLDTGWTVEIAIPWAALAGGAGRPSPPHAGDIWRVNFSRVQWRTHVVAGQYEKILDPDTGKSLPEDNWVWSPQGLIAMHCPEMWGEVLFVDGTGGTFAETPEHNDITVANLLMPIYYLQRQWQEEHGQYAAELRELGIAEGRLPVWPQTGAEVQTTKLPDNWTLLMSCGRDHFRVQLTTPEMTVTVDDQGKLLRRSR